MTSAGRVLFIGLDSMSWPLVQERLDAGRLPNFAALRERAAFARLDAGEAYSSGIAWESWLAGSAKRTSPVQFDPATYRVWQEGSSVVPFFAAPDGPRTIAFDIPNHSLAFPVAGLAVTAWGATAPCFPRASMPLGLLDDIDRTFGPHPACNNDYEIVWHRPDWVERLGAALCEGAVRRADVVAWLQTRAPDWQLCATVLSEPHSAAEALWHGVAPDHPLAGVASAAAAGRWMRRVDEAVDEAVGRLLATVNDDDYVVVVSMHGMGTNTTDVPSMVLLPELLHRAFVGRPFLRQPRGVVGSVPVLDPSSTWDETLERYVSGRLRAGIHRLMRRTVPEPMLRQLRRAMRRGAYQTPGETVDPGLFGTPVPAETDWWQSLDGPYRASLDWQVPARYRPKWPSMPAFALPSFGEGAIRLNVVGRERNGTIEPVDFEAWCDRVEGLLREVVDPATGEPVVADVHRAAAPNTGRAEAPDLTIRWRGSVLAFSHPSLGVIGPYPLRRTGDHADPTGFAFVAGPGIDRQDLGRHPASSVTPTVTALLGGVGRAVTGDPLVQPVGA